MQGITPCLYIIEKDKILFSHTCLYIMPGHTNNCDHFCRLHGKLHHDRDWMYPYRFGIAIIQNPDQNTY